jgi:hypothetical protein
VGLAYTIARLANFYSNFSAFARATQRVRISAAATVRVQSNPTSLGRLSLYTIIGGVERVAKTDSIPAFKANDVDADTSTDPTVGWVQLLSSSDRHAYWLARQAFDQATVMYNAAVLLAGQGLEKVKGDYQTVGDKYVAATLNFDAAMLTLAGTEESLKNLVNNPAATQSSAGNLTVPQLLQTLLTAFGTATQGLSAAALAWGTAYTALANASDPSPKGPFDPGKATINTDVLALAEATEAAAEAAAAVPHDKAWDVLLQKRMGLYAGLEDQSAPIKSGGSSAARAAARAAAH